MKKVLHITNWYPNEWNLFEGVFVKEQFKLFSQSFETKLINIQVRDGKSFFRFKHVKYSEDEEAYFLLTKIRSSKIRELFSSLLLIFVLLKSGYRKYDLLHFHIAYPLLVFYNIWKKIIRIPIVISEHWSAYHYNFYLTESTEKLKRVKGIFKQNIPIITVSKALLSDIEKFSNTQQHQSVIIPNVIDSEYFRYKESENRSNKIVFLMVNVWRKIKNPFPIFDALSNINSEIGDFELRIGGYGELMEEMKQYVISKKLENKIKFLGKLEKEEIAIQLSGAHAYLFSSDYETFSVACAQALSCGCPLIGPPLPAILEYAQPDKDILLVSENDEKEWQETITRFMMNISKFKRSHIAKEASRKFSSENIQTLYETFIDKTIYKND